MRKGKCTHSRTVVASKNPDFGIMSAIKARRVLDCYEVLESVAWIWRILAVFPIRIKGPIGMKRYLLDKSFAVYSLGCYALISGNFIYVMVYFDYYFRDNSALHLTAVTILIRAIGNQLCMIVSIVYRFFQHRELAESINSIPDQDWILEKMNCPTNYQSSTKIIRAYVFTSISAVIFLIVYDLIACLRNHNTFSAEYVLWNIGLLIQIIDITIFVSLIFLLGLNFQALNKKLRSVVTRANASSPKVIVTSDVCADNLLVISKAHFNICTIGKRINRIFEWDVVINVVTAFIIMSMTLYYIFYEVQTNAESKISRIISYVHWEFFHSVPIIIIVLICNWTSRQGIYAGKLIHEIRVEKKDSRLYEAVKSFSLQLHHQKLEFTACGFFPLDSTLIQTMIGKITTYLVILIQFQPKLD